MDVVCRRDHGHGHILDEGTFRGRTGSVDASACLVLGQRWWAFLVTTDSGWVKQELGRESGAFPIYVLGELFHPNRTKIENKMGLLR
jgi:hypothetical protein